MTENPYKASASPGVNKPTRRPVRRFLVLAALLVPLAIIALIPGATLLNQKHGWIQTSSSIDAIEINGYAILNKSVIEYSIGAAVTVLLLSTLFFTLAVRNRSTNRGRHSG